MVARPASFVFDRAEAGVAWSLVNSDKLRPDVQSRAVLWRVGQVHCM